AGRRAAGSRPHHVGPGVRQHLRLTETLTTAAAASATGSSDLRRDAENAHEQPQEAASNALTGLPNRQALIADSDMLFTVAAARARDLRPGRLQAVPRPVRTRRRRHHARHARPAAP